MSTPKYITGATPSELKERIPRLDQQARVVLKTLFLLGEHAVNNLVDLVRPAYIHHDENRLQYVRRRGEERNELLERELGAYILDKGFGTEETRQVLKSQQRLRV